MCSSDLEELLKLEQKTHNTKVENILWQRGYLTGILQSLLHNDPYIRTRLVRRVSQKNIIT